MSANKALMDGDHYNYVNKVFLVGAHKANTVADALVPT